MNLLERIRRFGKRQDGISAVEFSLIALLMCIILFAIIQFGAMFYHYNMMQNAARDGARRLAVDNDLYPGDNGSAVTCAAAQADSIEEYVCNIMDLPSDAATVAACITQDIEDVRYDAEVVVVAPMDEVSLIDLLGFTEGLNVTAVAVMRVENGKDPDPDGNMCGSSIPPLT